MKKILLVKTSSMGDMIHTLVALTDLQAKYPDAVVDWVAEENFQEIPLWHGIVRRVIPIALRRWRNHFSWVRSLPEIRNFLHTLREESYDYIIDAQGLLKSVLVLLGARGRGYGYDWNSAREPLASIFYRHKIAVAKGQHAILRTRILFANIFRYSFALDVLNFGIDKSRLPSTSFAGNYLLFFHGASKANKCWSESNWRKLMLLANEANLRVLLPSGSDEERERAQRIAEGCQFAVVLPTMSLAEIAGVTSRADAVIAVDTGLAYLAEALNIPSIILFGPTDLKLVGSVGKNHILLNDFDHISAEDVWQKLQDLVRCLVT